jgi:sialate O-acetylesterase
MKLNYTFFAGILFFLLLISISSEAEVKLPKIFSSNMVMQQGIPLPVWGWANPGEKVTATFNNTTIRTVAGRDGKWKVKLPVQSYGGPYTMTISGRNTITFTNVMIGEVWVCSGQSNMELPLATVNNAEAEVAAADFPDIRLFQVPKKVAQFPIDDIESGEWNICTPKSVSNFSAVGYFFGRHLHQQLKVPVGLLETAWGGTVAETWISGQSIENDPDFAESLARLTNMDMNKYNEEQKEKLRTLFGGEIPSEDRGIVNGEAVWSAIDLNDGDWKTLIAPKYWEDQGYAQIDGIAWYRKEVILTEAQTSSNVTLHLGKVDDSDITWMNGIEIGKTEGLYDKDRVYTIDKKYLRPGKNMIVVRVNDTGGNGGIWGDPREQFLAIGNDKVDLAGNWKFRIAKAVISSVNIGPNSYPTLLFNGMIQPLLPYGIRGAIWYQGESNADRAKQYQRIFPELITDWRRHWNQGDFPFLFVSLANYMAPAVKPEESNWAELREAQTKTLSLPNTGMAITIDIGDAKDIHPRNKQDVGLRLALNARKIAYGEEIVFAGPIFKSVEFTNGKAIVAFNQTGSGLMVKDRYGYVKGFTLAGKDKQFQWAQARITGKDQIEVVCDKISDPVAIRFGWANNPDDINLYNLEGLPAVPFRSDDH